MLKIISIVQNNTKYNPTKRFIATFNDEKKVYFGLKNPKKGTYIDHKDKNIRDAYIKRHIKDLETKNPQKPGYLSLFVLWGSKTNLADAMKDYNRRLKNNDWSLPK